MKFFTPVADDVEILLVRSFQINIRLSDFTYVHEKSHSVRQSLLQMTSLDTLLRNHKAVEVV